jgi:hypothetical protein
LVWFQLPLNFSQIVLASVWTVDWAWTMVGKVPTVNAAHAARMAIERMGTPAVNGRATRVPINERA